MNMLEGVTQPHAYTQLEGVNCMAVSTTMPASMSMNMQTSTLQVSFHGHYRAIQSQSPPACREDSECEEKARPGVNGEFQCVMHSLLLLISISLKEVAVGRGVAYVAHGPHTSQFSLDAEPRPLEVWGGKLALGVDTFQHLQSCHEQPKDNALS